MRFVSLYHVASAEDVESIQNDGVDPGPNDRTQYGRGFYIFVRLVDAIKYQTVLAATVSIETAILEFRISLDQWDQLHCRIIPEELNWVVPIAWLEECHVMLGAFDAPPEWETEALDGTFQAKFNPSAYAHLRDPRVWLEEP